MAASQFPRFSGMTKAQSGQQRKEIERTKREFFAEARDGFYISTREGQFLDCNQALVTMLGYESRAEMLSLNLTTELWANPEDSPRFQETIERQGFVRDYQGAFKHKSGRLVYVGLSSQVWRDDKGTIRGYRGFVVDRTQERLVDGRLALLETRYRDLFNNMQDGVFVSDEKGVVIDCNQALCDIVGYTKEEFLELDYYQCLFIDRNAVMDYRRQFTRSGRVSDYELQIARKDGAIRDVSMSGYASRNDEGQIVSYQGMMRDITQAKRLRMQLVQSEKLSAMGRMASQLAHELNNPIYGIMNCVDLVRSAFSASDEKKKYLDLAYNECKRTSGLLIKMLKFFKPDEDEKSSTDINKLLEETLFFYERQFKNLNIRVTTALGDLPMLKAVASQLKQVFINMIINANTAMPTGGELKVSSRFDQLQNEIVVSIEDTGVGIAPENINRIFEAFFTTKKEVKGVGLGLSICYELVRNHGGGIELDSKVGKGTTFHIHLPCGT
ncbi:MAG: PAS domain S-box protein [Deltaproteobacteria bacterium]|nr:PAS domain S-box protein [Deltaproteobacteria bacterium]